MTTPTTSERSSQGAPPKAPGRVLSTMDDQGNREWIYPVTSRGRFWKMRGLVAIVLVAIYLALPIIKVGGKPAIFLDIARREFTFFGLTLYPTDTELLVVGGVALLLTVALVTAVLGRAWCGWACPQTVYLEFIYRPIERLVEGKETKRKRRDKGPWTFDKVWRKGLKHGIFLVISLVLSHTFVAYFVGWEALSSWVGQTPTAHWSVFTVTAITTALIMFDFGYFREQMCTIACPYARLQSGLIDEHSMIVSYDPTRGEQRGRRTRAQRKKEKQGITIELGDCIDCGACVRTCPTGIDIRDGLQMECVNCTQCIDACDDIMDSIGKPRGLIRFTSLNALEEKETKIVRPRTIAYSLLLVALVGVFGWALNARGGVDVDVGRTKGAPYQMIQEDKVANRLRFRIQNRSGQDHTYTLEALEPAGAELKVVGQPALQIDAGHMKRVETWVVVPDAAFDDGKASGKFAVKADDETVEEIDFRLIGPQR